MMIKTRNCTITTNRYTSSIHLFSKQYGYYRIERYAMECLDRNGQRLSDGINKNNTYPKACKLFQKKLQALFFTDYYAVIYSDYFINGSSMG